MDRVSQLSKVQQEALELFKQKNQDYGDSFAVFGPVGVIVRISDKINRLVSITNSNVSLIKTESIRDTLIDLHNYSAMAIMLMDEKKVDIEKKEKRQTQFSTDIFENKLGMPKNDSVGHELYLEDNFF